MKVQIKYFSKDAKRVEKISKGSWIDLASNEDVTLKKNQCLIETDGGIFDCSLGVELKELKKQLLLLSYDGVQRG